MVADPKTGNPLLSSHISAVDAHQMDHTQVDTAHTWRSINFETQSTVAEQLSALIKRSFEWPGWVR